jgi:glycosyltransferase involved in cell wall biosynthesis
VNVLHVGKFYFPYLGGMETALKAVCEADAGATRTEALVANVDRHTVVDHVGTIRVTRAGLWALISAVPFCPSFPYWIRRRAADIVVLHEPNPLALFSYLVARPRGRMVIWFHSEIVGRRWFSFFYRPFLRRALRLSARLVVSSPTIFEHNPTLQPFRNKCVVIPYGIRPERFEATPALEARVADIRRSIGRPIVLFVGRLTYYKGVETLLRAMEHVNATVLIAGRGPRRVEFEAEAWRRGLQDNVRFLGEIAEADLPAYYHASDVFVLPSTERAEAFGIVQLEAMACGRPVVSTDLPTGVPWVNRHGVTGLVVEPKNPAALAGAINTLLRDDDLRARYGAAGRARVQKEFTEPRMHARLASLYRSLFTRAGVDPVADDAALDSDAEVA